MEACERSLRRLSTDVLDLYLLHWWSGEHPLEECIAGLLDVVEVGKARAIGVSNFDADELSEAVRLAGFGVIACNQVLYHLKERGIEHRVAPRCRELGVAVVAYSPFGQGDFPSRVSAGGRVLGAVAREVGATVRQVALAFLLREPGTFAIPKAARVAHVEDNAGALGLTLSDEQIARIAAAFPEGSPRGLQML
jgi:diketogulonate reductase-like aldo/keto reductase